MENTNKTLKTYLVTRTQLNDGLLHSGVHFDVSYVGGNFISGCIKLRGRYLCMVGLWLGSEYIELATSDETGYECATIESLFVGRWEE